jgi:RimJ/RimL family protein N-acetyltransferase
MHEAILETPRLSLRRVTPADAPFMLALVNDPAWLRHIGDRGIRTPQAARDYNETRFTAMYERLGFGLWMVEEKARAVPMGICGLVKRDALEEVDLGFAFLPGYRGKGYAYESAVAVRDHATGALGMKRLLAITSPVNHESARLLGRLGFVLEREMAWQGDEKDRVSVYAFSA